MAEDIEKYRRQIIEDFSRVRKISPRKGMKTLTTLAKAAQKRSDKVTKQAERDLNPRFKAKGVPGLTPDEDGKIGLVEARKQRPDLFDGSLSKPANEHKRRMMEHGKQRKSDRPEAGSAVPDEAEEGVSELSGLHGVLLP